MSLTKAEVNERFYNAIAGEVVFDTEAQNFIHPLAVARLVAAHANARGKGRIKILELGANECGFATALLKLLSSLTAHGEASLERIDYFAVEFARKSLESMFIRSDGAGFNNVTGGAPGGPLVATLTRDAVPEVKLHLVHAEAGRFVSGGTGDYDVVIINELLDDLSCRAFYADATGAKHELLAHAAPGDDDTWTVTVTAPDTADAPADLPPSTVTVTSPESLAVVRGAARLLASGGLMLVHDYGFVDPHVSVTEYQREVVLPSFATIELPPGSGSDFPSTFFRVFGNEDARVVQITTDVSFAELADELRPSGTVIVLSHGGAVLQARDTEGDFRKGDGVFLGEFGAVELPDDLNALYSRLEAEQHDLWRRYSDEHVDGHASLFADLLFIKR